MIRENGETHISNKYLDKKQRRHQSGGEKLQELLIMGRRCDNRGCSSHSISYFYSGYLSTVDIYLPDTSRDNVTTHQSSGSQSRNPLANGLLAILSWVI